MEVPEGVTSRLVGPKAPVVLSTIPMAVTETLNTTPTSVNTLGVMLRGSAIVEMRFSLRKRQTPTRYAEGYSLIMTTSSGMGVGPRSMTHPI
jgi:hypothetical protein